jgi:hypothetical protein
MATNLNSKNYDNTFKGLFIGPTGAGKTIAEASWPGKTLIIDFDGRHKPIFKWYPERVKAGDFVVETIDYSNFNSTMSGIQDSLKNYNPYDNIILDGITSSTLTIISMLLYNKKGFTSFFAKSIQSENKGSKVTLGGTIVPGWDEFNALAGIMGYMIETLKGFKCNLFVSAHPVKRTVIDGTKSETRSSIVAFGPKIESMIPNYFDEVWYFDYSIEYDQTGKEVIKRICHTGPSVKYFDAKTSLDIPKEIDYTDKNLYDCVKEYISVAEPVL